MEEKNNLNSGGYTLQSFLICGLCAMFYFYQYILRVVPGQCVNIIMSDLQVGASFIGQLSSAYLLMYALAQMPVSILLDKYGPKKCAVGGLLMLSISAILQSAACCPTNSLIARGLTGLCSAFGLMCTLQMIDKWFPTSVRGRATNAVILFGMCGAMASQHIVTIALSYTTRWRIIFGILAVIGIALSFLFSITLNDNGPYANTKSATISEKESSFHLYSASMIITGIYACFAYIPLGVIIDNWASKVDLDLGVNGFMSIQSALLLGMMIGLVFFGQLADTVGFKTAILFGGLTNALLLLSLCILPISYFTYIFLMIGIMTASSVLPIPFGAFLVPPTSAATARGIINSAQMFGAAFLTGAFGWFLDKMGPVAIVDGAAIYSAETYSLIFAGSALSILISTALLVFIKPTNQ